MKKWPVTLLSLLLTGALLFALTRRPPSAPQRQKGISILRVWLAESDPQAARWVRGAAAAYERARNERIYLRSAGKEEAEAALRGAPDAVGPDLLLGRGDEAAALRGYALILRDGGAQPLTPAATSSLFFRPSPSPGPAPAQPSPPPWEEIGAVLTEKGMLGAVPGTVESADPARELAAGRARAALLTAETAARLACGYRAYPVPRGQGFSPLTAAALTDRGRAFLDYLKGNEAQSLLRNSGLYALDARLYGPEDPLRFLIDAGRANAAPPADSP